MARMLQAKRSCCCVEIGEGAVLSSWVVLVLKEKAGQVVRSLLLGSGVRWSRGKRKNTQELDFYHQCSCTERSFEAHTY